MKSILIYLLLHILFQTSIYRFVLIVIDGDTIKTNQHETIRFLGVDTPELHHPHRPTECYANEAKQFTKKQVLNKRVLLTFEYPYKDKYNRTLAWVWYGYNYKTLLNLEIIKQGYGFSYKKYPTSKLKELNEAENTAKTYRKGLWNSKICNYP